jgi:L-threonylcarbamoyladenylate synthase
LTLRVFDGSSDAHLREAGNIIRNGGIIAIPTETVYGLAANAADAEAVGRIFSMKGRPQDNPLITHIASPDDLAMLCREVPEAAINLARHFWPGPLTLVLPSAGAVCERVTAGLASVAVRCPAHSVARAVIRCAKTPLAAPSANPSGRPSPTSAAHVIADYPEKFDGFHGVVDGGLCAVGVESTVLDLSGKVPALLRYGGVSAEELQPFLPDLVIQTRPKDNIARSPGQKHRHYAPATPLFLLPDCLEDAVNVLRKDGRKHAVLCPDHEAPYFSGAAVVTFGSTPGEMAAQLFGAMRQADALKMEVLFARVPAGDGILNAVRDRLCRAADSRFPLFKMV